MFWGGIFNQNSIDPIIFGLYHKSELKMSKNPSRHRRVLEHSPAADPSNCSWQLTGLVSLYHSFLRLFNDYRTAATACLANAAVFYWLRPVGAGRPRDALPVPFIPHQFTSYIHQNERVLSLSTKGVTHESGFYRG